MTLKPVQTFYVLSRSAVQEVPHGTLVSAIPSGHADAEDVG
jgi:hypothetical protein